MKVRLVGLLAAAAMALLMAWLIWGLMDMVEELIRAPWGP